MITLALAHQSAIKYVDLIVDETTISAKVTVAPSDIVDAPEPHARFVRDWIAIEGCNPGEAKASPDLDGRFVVVTWEVQCFAAPSELDLDLSRFFAADPRHEAIVHVSDIEEPIVIRADAPRWTIPVGKPGIWRGWYVVIPSVVIGVGLGALLMRQARRT